MQDILDHRFVIIFLLWIQDTENLAFIFIFLENSWIIVQQRVPMNFEGIGMW